MPPPTYPASSDVAATNKTRASHYNNLRKDALRLGADSADALNIGDLLARYIRNVRPAYLATNRIRIPYDSIRPPTLVVGGYILKAAADIDLAASSFSGGAATWYIFANRVAGSTTFTLTVNTTATEGADQRRIGSCYWDGTNLDQGSIRAEEFERDIYFNLGADAEKHTSPAQGDVYFATNTQTLYICYVAGTWLSLGTSPMVCEGRLTLTSGTPVTTSDVASSTNVYFTPRCGNRIALYSGSAWLIRTFSELTLALGTVTSGIGYDIFAYDNAGTVALEKLAWANATTRATALTTQDGVLVKSGDATRRYLGSFYTISATQTADKASQRFLWNYYNRVPRILTVQELTASWTLNSLGPRYSNNSSANRVEFILGWPESPVEMTFRETVEHLLTGARQIYIGIGLDVNTSLTECTRLIANTLSVHEIGATYKGIPAVGYHYLAALELANNQWAQYFGGTDYWSFLGSIEG